jgi:GGDEF domain-containing protein
MHQATPRRRRARPVADAPIEALLARSDDLAKGWLLELVDQAPLADAASILAGELAGSGPVLCAAMIRALGSDQELQALGRGGAHEALAARISAIAGATAAEPTARALDALMAVLWSAIRASLPAPEADLVAELAERLAHVIEVVRQLALGSLETNGNGVAIHHAPAPPVPDEPAANAELGNDAFGEVLAEEGLAEEGLADEDVLEAELDEEEEAFFDDGLRLTDRRGQALWIGAIDDEIDRAQSTGRPLSLLLVVLEDADRVLAVEDAREASTTFGRFAQAVRSVVRRQDILACENGSRAWIIACDSSRASAQALGGRVAEAVRAAGPWRGAPMTAGVGLAVLGEDGHDSSSLMGAAEEARFAAAAGGLGVSDGESRPKRPPPRRPRPVF